MVRSLADRTFQLRPGAFMAQAREEGPGPGAYYSVEDEVSVDGTSVLAQNGVALCYF